MYNIQVIHSKIPNIHIGKIPIMLRSSICVLTQYNHLDHNTTGECKYDAGGYFIINGSEKTVLGQERAAENKVYCFNVKKNSISSHARLHIMTDGGVSRLRSFGELKNKKCRNKTINLTYVLNDAVPNDANNAHVGRAEHV